MDIEWGLMITGIIMVIIGYVVGLCAMYCYMIMRLKYLGYNWKLIKNRKNLNKYKDRDKHRRYEKNKMNLESAKQNEFDCQERFR